MRLKEFSIPIIFAVVISSIQFWIAIRFSAEILWQVTLMYHLVGSGPILGYRNGQPIYEGTPVHMVAAYIGIGIGVIVYWVIGFFIMRLYNHRLQRKR